MAVYPGGNGRARCPITACAEDAFEAAKNLKLRTGSELMHYIAGKLHERAVYESGRGGNLAEHFNDAGRLVNHIAGYLLAVAE